jgi:hypothetical protein
MRAPAFAAVFAVTASAVANGEPARGKGTFLGPGIYATKDGCKKLAALTAGGDKNVATVPETLTEDGFEGWEGSCFHLDHRTKKGKKWRALMHCFDDPEVGPESDIFERMPDGRLKVTVMAKPRFFSAATLIRETRP